MKKKQLGKNAAQQHQTPVPFLDMIQFGTVGCHREWLNPSSVYHLDRGL